MQGNIGYMMVLGASLLWGCIGIFVNAISGLGITSGSMAAFRLLFGAFALIPVLCVMGTRGIGLARGSQCDPLAYFRIAPRQLLTCAGMGILAVAMSNCCYYESMRAVGMSTASVLLYTQPVFACFLGRLFFGEGVRRDKVVALALNVVGCTLAVTDGDLATFGFSLYGVGVGVLSGFLASFMPIFSKFATASTNPFTVTFYGFVFGGLFMGAVACPWADVAAALGPQLILLFAGFGLVPTALAYLMYMGGLAQGLEASKVPVVASFETVTTVLVGILLFSESAGVVKMLGIALVLLSIAAMNVQTAALRGTALAGRVAEAAAFSPRAWSEQKAAMCRDFLGGDDWQTWVPTR